MEFGYSVDHLVVSNQVLLLRRLCFWLSGNCLGSEDVLFEEALLDELFQVPLEGPTIDSFMPFTVMIGAVFLQPQK